jgi:hypothetical protein
MFDFSIAIVPLIVITFVNFFFSWIWYSPLLFMKPWAKALNLNTSGTCPIFSLVGFLRLFSSPTVYKYLFIVYT